MTYIAAILLDGKALCDNVFAFRCEDDAQWLCSFLKSSSGAEVSVMLRPELRNPSMFCIYEAQSWFLGKYELKCNLEEHFLQSFMYSSNRIPYLVTNLRPHLVEIEAPPIIDYFWQDHGLSRRDWEAYVMAAESPRPAPWLPDTRWFHEGLDREDWEAYLQFDSRREALLEEGWDAEDIGTLSETEFDEGEHDAYRDMRDDVLWEATFSANGGYSNSAAMGVYPEPPFAVYDTDDTYTRVAEENGIDDWKVRGPADWSYDPRGDD